MSKPKLSICTTNYNCAHALEQHFDSIYSQLDESEFEYIVVDSKSKDASKDILKKFSDSHENITVLHKKCIRGIGRQIAFEESKGEYIIQVDTDTRYLPIWRPFLDLSLEKYPKMAIQAIFSGIYPRDVLEQVGGWKDYQYAEDFELWMRIWKIGKMKWYPLRVGINIKDREGYEDIYSQRFSKSEALIRLLRHEYDWIRLHHYRKMDVITILKENSVDFGFGNLEDNWFGGRGSLGFRKWIRKISSNVWNILVREGIV
jgi:glycosyltransferase involved in cell wall biosynthesis